MTKNKSRIKRGLLCSLLSVILLLAGICIMSPQTNKASARESDYWLLDTFNGSYVEYDQCTISITRENPSYFMTLPKVDFASIDINSTKFLSINLFMRNSKGVESTKPFLSNASLCAELLTKSVKVDLTSYLPKDVVEEYSFYVSYEFSDLQDYQYSTQLSSVLKYSFVQPQPLPPDPAKEGYTFVGWFLDSEFTTAYSGQPIFADTMLYAKFVINTYSVTFDSVGGSAVNTQTVDWNTSATITDPTREGYNFMGWFLADGTQYTNQAIKENTTLTAKWEIKIYTITFMVENEVYKSVQVEHGTSLFDAMQSANLTYYAPLNDKGERLGKATIITSEVAVPIVEMTQEEKVATFVGNNWWLLYTVGGLVVALGIALAIAIAVAKNKG